MANHFVDTTLATGANDGSSTDDAWQTIEAAIESTVYTPSSNEERIWIRRASSESGYTSLLQPAEDGFSNSYMYCIGWPRPERTGTGDFTQGSNVIASVSTISPDRESHVCRRIKNDTNGYWYLITAIAHKIDYDSETGNFTEGLMVTGGTSGATGKIHKITDNGTTGSLWVVVPVISAAFSDGEQITDTNTGSADVNGTPSDDGFIIDRPYAGSTDSSANLTIQKDDDYDLAQTIDDSSWTIKLSSWNSDPDTLPQIDFETTEYNLWYGQNYWSWRNLDIRNSGYTWGTVMWRIIRHCEMIGCLFTQTEIGNSENIIRVHDNANSVYLERIVAEGSNGGTGQVCLHLAASSTHYINDCAFYYAGGSGISNDSSIAYLDNINSGVELPNAVADVSVSNPGCSIYSKDLQVGGDGSSGGIDLYIFRNRSSIISENHQKVLGAYYRGGNSSHIYKVDVVTGSGDPQKRTGGGDSVLQIYENYINPDNEKSDRFSDTVFESIFYQKTGTKTYRFYLQNDSLGNINSSDDYESANIWLEAEYLEKYNSNTQYLYARPYNAAKIARSTSSNNPIPDRDSTSDWDDYIQVSVTVPVDSHVRIACKMSWYVAGGGENLYIDPKPEVL